jgi:hypothetical protein
MPTPLVNSYLNTRSTANEVILTAQLMHALFDHSLDASLLHYVPSGLDFIPSDGNGTSNVKIRPGLAHGLWFSLQRLGEIIFCAANDYKPGVSWGPLPTTISADALAQISLPFPSVCYTVLYPDSNPLLLSQPRETQDIIIAALQWCGMNALRWINNAIERSALWDEESLWEWEDTFNLRPRPSLDFGYFRSQVLTELNDLQRNGTLLDDFGPGNDFRTVVDPSRVLYRPRPDSRSVAELRIFLHSIHNIFPAVDEHFLTVRNAAQTVNGAHDDSIIEALNDMGLYNIDN